MATEHAGKPTADATWDEHYADEKDAAWLYRELARVETHTERRDLFSRLAGVEDRHTARWEELFREAGRPLPPYAVGRRTRWLAWIARMLGPGAVLPLVLAEEGREVQAYLGLARASSHATTHKAALDIAAESAVHARELSEVMGREGEPWHVGGAGGLLRSIVYGFNDGLTANFGLVAGVVGADLGGHVVIVTGVAGAIADALSMGSSGYLAAKSEAEVQTHQIEMERQEMRLMPDLEEEELALIYEAKGIPPGNAREMAKTIMMDPARALETQVREELNIHPAELAPLKDGIVTGTATAVGAFIPILPFLVMDHAPAVWVSLAISMAAHFGIGAARSLFTGRGVWVSGRDMFAVGFGVAAVGYIIGEWLPKIM
ncbi:MAG TPA: VIT1/CCC1 transporter family protein [Vicinamibacterales bacterium]|nr:VIT1/CCC1 transporter family protein [Vicinamibacterales bacterium]